jgi:hypothetical protein
VDDCGLAVSQGSTLLRCRIFMLAFTFDLTLNPLNPLHR